jgi:hypothetical protein
MIDEHFVILAAGLNLIGTITYIIPTLKGTIRPNRVTWFLWALAPLIAFAAEIGQGVGLISLTTFMVGFGPFLILLASFVNKKAEWKLTAFDLVCGLLSILGLAMWFFTRIGNIAIVFSIMADALAALPTLRKGYLHPETEDYRIFLLGGIGAGITLLAISTWAFAFYGFPLYILLINTALVAAIKLGRK